MIETVNIDDIRIRLFDENQVINPYKIENTPHYKLLCGNRKEYDVYYDRMHNFGRAKNHYMNADEYLEFFPTLAIKNFPLIKFVIRTGVSFFKLMFKIVRDLLLIFLLTIFFFNSVSS